jgi:DNA polymerase (family 10)
MFNSTSDSRAFDTDDGTSSELTQRATSPRLSNEALASGLDSIAQLLATEGGTFLRREALRRAAALIRACTMSVAQSVDDAGVEAVHGLGINYELSGVVTDWVRSGRLHWLEKLRSHRRNELTHLPGIGPRLAEELRDVLGVVDVDGLAEAARDGRLLNVCGFGPKRLKLVTGVLAGRATRAPRPKESRQLTLTAAR